MPTTYSIEEAKSGRSSCKKCKTKIVKGELRIGVHSEFDDKVMTKWSKVGCFTLPRKLDVTVEEFLDEYLDDETSGKFLQDETKRQEIIDQLSAKKEKKTKKSDGGDGGKSSAFLESVKLNAAVLEEENGNDEDEPKKKKTKKMSEDDKKKAKAYLKYKGMKNGELQDILSWNKVVKSGNKDVLLTRVIDGYVYGRIGKCVSCLEGNPKISEDGSEVVCNGFYDKDKGFHVSCGSKIKVKDADRHKPWFGHEPTEEEEETMKQEYNPDSDKKDQKVPEKIMKAVKKIDWDLSGQKQIKKAVSEIIDICSAESSPIDFPSNQSKTKMDIGMMIVQNRDKDAVAVLELVIDKYGLKKKNTEDAKKRAEQVKAVVNVASNASIYEVLQELSSLYFKEKNTNAGASYRKVAQAVKDFDFEITVENAKGLGKGKTKVVGIGKGSAEKMHEFLSTGKIAKLEEKRAAQS